MSTPEVVDRASIMLRDAACQQWATRAPASAAVLLNHLARAVRHDAELRRLITKQEGTNRDPKGPRGREVRTMRDQHAEKIVEIMDALEPIVAPYRPKARG